MSLPANPIPGGVPVTPTRPSLALPPREEPAPHWLRPWNEVGLHRAEDHTTQRRCKAAPIDREQGDVQP